MTSRSARFGSVLWCRELAAVDELDPVAVRILDEADPADLGAAAGGERRLLGLDADLRQLREERVEVVDGERDVVVAVAEVVRLGAADVDRQLERVGVTRQAHVDVVRGLELEPPAALV